MSHWEEFDYAIVNDDLQRAVAALENVIDGRGEDSRVGAPALDRQVRQILASPGAGA
jgi:guanylate kinase